MAGTAATGVAAIQGDVKPALEILVAQNEYTVGVSKKIRVWVTDAAGDPAKNLQLNVFSDDIGVSGDLPENITTDVTGVAWVPITPIAVGAFNLYVEDNNHNMGQACETVGHQTVTWLVAGNQPFVAYPGQTSQPTGLASVTPIITPSLAPP